MPATLNPETLKTLPFRRLFLRYLNQSETELFTEAMHGISYAFGNPPKLLEEDPEYREFIRTYVTEVLVPYVARGGENQLGLIARLVGSDSVDSTLRICRRFMKELEKLREVLVLNEEAAELIFADEDRQLSFFTAFAAVSAFGCQQEGKTARLFGFKKTFTGRWKASKR